ncbi:MAG: TIGR02452 family protein [Rhabdochlamydiaceae bacterium]
MSTSPIPSSNTSPRIPEGTVPPQVRSQPKSLTESSISSASGEEPSGGWCIVNLFYSLCFCIANAFRALFGSKKEDTSQIKPYVGKDHGQVLKSALELIAQGFYINQEGQKLDLQKGEVLSAKSRYFEFKPIEPVILAKYKTEIRVVELDSLGAAQRERENFEKVLVVNLASPEYPGGGLEGGPGGQEEDLCYRSELAGFMKDQLQIVYETLGILDQEHKRLYPLYRYQDPSTPGSVLTPDVTVFRDSIKQSFALLKKPFQIGVLSSAAPHDLKSIETNVRLKGKDQNSDEYRDIKKAILEEVKLKAEKSMINQLSVAYEAGYECIVLGAFGCGAFKIPQKET